MAKPGVSAEHWEILQRCRFARRTFTPYSFLRSIEPVARDVEAGYHVSIPYKEQPFDSEKFERVEGGWNHEHCWICLALIAEGDEYRLNEEEDEVELCLDCYRRIEVYFQAK